MGRAINLLVWMSSNRIAIILYQGYKRENVRLLISFEKDFITDFYEFYHHAIGNFPPWNWEKKSLFHIGTGSDIRPQKRSRKITVPSFIFVIVRSLMERKWICAAFLLFVCICIVVGDPIIRGRGMGSNNWFCPAIFLCLSIVMTLDSQMFDMEEKQGFIKSKLNNLELYQI